MIGRGNLVEVVSCFGVWRQGACNKCEKHCKTVRKKTFSLTKDSQLESPHLGRNKISKKNQS